MQYMYGKRQKPKKIGYGYGGVQEFFYVVLEDSVDITSMPYFTDRSTITKANRT